MHTTTVPSEQEASIVGWQLHAKSPLQLVQITKADRNPFTHELDAHFPRPPVGMTDPPNLTTWRPPTTHPRSARPAHRWETATRASRPRPQAIGPALVINSSGTPPLAANHSTTNGRPNRVTDGTSWTVLLQVLFQVVNGPAGLAKDGAEGAGRKAAVKRNDDGSLAIAVLSVTAAGGDVLETTALQGFADIHTRQVRGNGRAHATRRTSTGAVITSVTSGAGASSK